MQPKQTGNHGGPISLQTEINRLRVRNVRPRRPRVGLVLTQQNCQGVRSTAHNEHVRASFLSDKA